MAAEYDPLRYLDLLEEYTSSETVRVRRNLSTVAFVVIIVHLFQAPLDKLEIRRRAPPQVTRTACRFGRIDPPGVLGLPVRGACLARQSDPTRASHLGPGLDWRCESSDAKVG